MKQALTIAGSDSGGGAGIQADLKTMHAHGVFGASVITAITAQNTVAVTEAYELPIGLIQSQLEAVLGDFDIAAVKTGMLSSAGVVAAVADTLAARRPDNLVIDPVMISKSGYKLLEDAAIETLTTALLPLALVVTPNLHEAELLADTTIESPDHVRRAARRICEYGCKNVLLTGGHADFDKAVDVLYDGRDFHRFEAPRIDARDLHGTGCTYSAAITARLALGEPLIDAIGHAKHYMTRAIGEAPEIGHGHGPTHHFYFVNPDDYAK